MNSTLQLPKKLQRNFIPKDYVVTNWKSLQPYYLNLLNRGINTEEEFTQWLRDYSELSAMVGEDIRWKYVKTSIDTTDVEAQERLNFFYSEIEPKMKVIANDLLVKLNSSRFKSTIENNKDFRNFLLGIEKDLHLFTEKNVSIQKELSIEENQYAVISGQWTIEHDGEIYTLQQAAKFLKNTDRALREKIYKKIADRRLLDEKKLDDLLLSLIKKRDKVAKNAGYENFRDYQFDAKHRFDYSPEDCLNFCNSVAESVVPVAEKVAVFRKNSLKVDKLRPWDTAVDVEGRKPLTPFNTTNEFLEKTINCFNELDPFFGECIAIMDEMGHLDLESRQGKAPGGYNMAMPESGAPFIFMNHACSEGDVRVMVHEGGHAVHALLAHQLPFDFFKSTPSEVAELASMSMELFSLEYWEKFYSSEEDLKRAKINHLEGLVSTLQGVAKGDEFQHWLYLNPTSTAREIKEKWTVLTNKYGVKTIDFTGFEEEQSSSYQRILHFYQVPFYYIEYGFAQLGAIALWRNFKQNKEKTIEEYKNALKLGYTRSIHEIYETAGIRFDFTKEYVSELLEFLQAEIEKLR